MSEHTNERKIVALIPARGGSKGIPRKNVAELGGKPLIAYSIEHSLAASTVDRTIVSTDDDEIAEIARAWGAEVVRRPAEIAGDEASSESALTHALDLLADDGYRPDLVVFLQATSPIREPHAIDEAIRTLDEQRADSLFSASPVHGFVWRRGARGPAGAEPELRSLTYDYRERPRRQDIGDDFLENGSLYVFKPEILERHGNRLGGRIAIYPMPALHSFQIDEPSDLVLFERLVAIEPGAGGITPNRKLPTRQRLAKIELLVLDFDGVLTDNRVLVSQDGTESVHCHRGDGYGLERLRRAGLEALVLSKEKNPVVAARCRKLHLECHQGFDDKLPKLISLAEARGLESGQVAYVGNDVNDLECLLYAGLAVAVADAHPEAMTAAHWVTERSGGHGAVREVCDRLLEAHGA